MPSGPIGLRPMIDGEKNRPKLSDSEPGVGIEASTAAPSCVIGLRPSAC